MPAVFLFLYKGCTLAPPGEYDWTVHLFAFKCQCLSQIACRTFVSCRYY